MGTTFVEVGGNYLQEQQPKGQSQGGSWKHSESRSWNIIYHVFPFNLFVAWELGCSNLKGLFLDGFRISNSPLF